MEKGMIEEKPLALYGAGMVAVSVYYAVKELYPDRGIAAFIVSEREGNPGEIDGIPVLSLDEFHGSQTCQKAKILLATPENHHNAIAGELKKRGLGDFICIDSKREAALMEKYYRAIKEFQVLRTYPAGIMRKGGRASLDVYMTRFHKDMPLKNPYSPPGWLHPIQAGAALTEERIADTRDDMGENISEKNRNYSELSAMYWVGKNGGGAEYLGLFHYRRVLDITEEDLYRMGEHDIDVVLPYPTVHFPSIDEHHRRYVKDEDWEAMLMALRELAPEYGKSFNRIFSQPYFYNYNMLIARAGVFKDYCDWLFPILKRTEELSVPKGWERADRYIGYLGENLTTLYFMYHRNDFKIAHTGRLMLI